MKLATWNVNSLNVRLAHVTDWLKAHPVDVLCLQELKLESEKFPFAEIEALGYHVACEGQKTYNGVAILSRTPLEDVVRGIPGFSDEQRRYIAATVAGVRVICVYVPNGQAVGSEKYAYKLRWLESLRAHLAEELRRHESLAILGDYNIAPEDRDVHDPKAWEGAVLCSDAERAALRAITDLGLVDSFRLFEQPEGAFSWWDYRMNGFRRKLGLRIDHILVTQPLAARCVSCHIDVEPRKLERPSDHAPVVAELQ